MKEASKTKGGKISNVLGDRRCASSTKIALQTRVVVTVGRDEKEIRDYRVDQLKFKPKRRRDRGNVNDAELKALEALEKKEGKSKLDDN